MSTSRRGNYVNYQARASAFEVGDRVYPILKGNPSNGGTVVAVWPAIGMVDVQYPHGTARAAVEDLVVDRGKSIESEVDIQSDTVPGGTHTVPVSGGPGPERTDSAHRVASRHIKRAVYWAAPDRQYRPTKAEIESGNLCCPRCDEAYLRKTVYKREGGASTRLYCCPQCLFLIRRDDIIGFEE